MEFNPLVRAVSTVALAATAFFTAAAFMTLPADAVLAIHWNIDGVADGFAGREALLIVPVTTVVVGGLLWLAVFYVYPAVQMFMASFWSGTVEQGYVFGLENWTNYSRAVSQFGPFYVRSIAYAFAATLLTFLVAYPLAYTIAFRGGRQKNLLLFLVVPVLLFLVPFVLDLFPFFLFEVLFLFLVVKSHRGRTRQSQIQHCDSGIQFHLRAHCQSNR